VKQMGIWRIGDDVPQKVVPANVDIEKQLEDWIERDPTMLQADWTIVGRQVKTEAGSLDLLAIDPQGRWVVIELKRGTVYRETLAQALDYAACIAQMPEDELRKVTSAYSRGDARTETPRSNESLVDGEEDGRELSICVVGTGRDPNLDRLVAFLSGRYGIPITVVTFEVYQLQGGDRLLVRQLAEVETASLERVGRKALTVDELCQRTDAKGIGPQFRSIVLAAERNSLHLRAWTKSLMVAPRANRTRSLVSVLTRPNKSGEMSVWFDPEVFAEFYPPLTQAEVAAELGEGGWVEMSPDQVDRFVAVLDRLFAKLRSTPLAEMGTIADGPLPGSGWAAEELERLADEKGIDPYDYEPWVDVAEAIQKINKDG
jgi:hypothetical protein